MKRAVVMGALQIVAVISTWARFAPLVKLGDYGEPPQTRSCTRRWHSRLFAIDTLFESSTPVLCRGRVQHLDRATDRVPGLLGESVSCSLGLHVCERCERL